MGLRLELARRHGVLGRRRRLLVGIPRLLLLLLLGIGVGRAIVMRVVLVVVVVGRGIGVVVNGRMCLGRQLVVIVLLVVPSRRHVGAGHRGRCRPSCLDSRRPGEVRV
jgi:hypothetical protein